MYCSNCGVQNNVGAKFCKDCGTVLADSISTPSTQTSSEHVHLVKAPKSVLFYVLAPIIAFIGIVILWGIVSLIFESSPSSPTLDFFDNTLIPFLMAIAFLAIPVGVIYGIYSNSKHYDGTVKCGNCNYIGVGKKGRSTWAQVVVWILFFVSPLITLIYYLATQKYVCPKCNSTFLGLRDVNGNFSSTKGHLGALGIILLVLLFIIIIGILSAVVLASLGEARKAGIEASQIASTSQQQKLLNSLKIIQSYFVKIYFLVTSV